jgi:hypothetical protein
VVVIIVRAFLSSFSPSVSSPAKRKLAQFVFPFSLFRALARAQQKRFFLCFVVAALHFFPILSSFVLEE